MLGAVLSAFPIALGTIVATLPMVAIPLLLVTRPDQSVMRGFLTGWFAGFLALGGAAIALADVVVFAGNGGGMVWLRLGLGLALVGLAVMKWRKGAAAGENPKLPAWMSRVDTMSPAQATALGAAMATINPKNAVLIASAALTIAATTPRPTAQAAAFVLHSIIASLGLLAPVLATTIAGNSARAPLDRLRQFIARHNATVMAVVLGAIGLIVVVNAVRDF